MKTLFYKFILYFYQNYIVEKDFEILNIWGKIIIRPFWFIKCILLILISPLIFLIFLFEKTKLYKNIKLHEELILKNLK